MTKSDIITAFEAISAAMTENKDRLVELDARSGDGDLGISMNDGFKAACAAIKNSEGNDPGRAVFAAARAFNESAPSSLGTIISVGLTGIAKRLRGEEEFGLAVAAEAIAAGISAIMEKTGTKTGERTFIDAVYPASQTLLQACEQGKDIREAFSAAAKAAASGCEDTKEMLPVHGRSAYYGEKLLGFTDGGAEVGKLIFAVLSDIAGTL